MTRRPRRPCYAAGMPEPNPFPRVGRAVIAAALVVWLAADIWLIARLASAQGHYGSAHPFVSAGELLVPAGLLALFALILVVVPWRFNAGWGLVFLFAVLGVPAWVFLRRGVHNVVPDVSGAVAAAVAWMTLGLTLGLIALSLLALRGTREPLESPDLTRDAIQSLAHLDAPEELDGHLPPRM